MGIIEQTYVSIEQSTGATEQDMGQKQQGMGIIEQTYVSIEQSLVPKIK